MSYFLLIAVRVISPILGSRVTLGNEKIDQVGSFSYLGSIISKDGGRSDDVKSRIARAQGVFSQLKKNFGRIERQVYIPRLEYWKLQWWQWSNMALKHGHSEKQMKIYWMFSREIAYGLFWIPGWLTVFQTVGCTKSVVQSRFLGQ